MLNLCQQSDKAAKLVAPHFLLPKSTSPTRQSLPASFDEEVNQRQLIDKRLLKKTGLKKHPRMLNSFMALKSKPFHVGKEGRSDDRGAGTPSWTLSKIADQRQTPRMKLFPMTTVSKQPPRI